MKDILIVGASGFGREVAWLIERINEVEATWNILGFLDDNAALHNTIVGGYSVLGSSEMVAKYPEAWLTCAIGSAKIRQRIIDKIEAISDKPPRFATLIDPSVIRSQRVAIGEGSIICAHTILTVDIQIGTHVIINLDCTIGHDAVIEDFATLYPSVNISGATRIGRCTELGTGMQIIQGKTIGHEAIIGAGTVVVKDIPPQCTAVGIPARVIKREEEEGTTA